MLSKHPGRCKFPHGHSRTITVVVSAPRLNEHDMVCDFKALKLALKSVCDELDHSLAINSADPLLSRLQSVQERVVVFQGQDPTTEVLARRIHDGLTALVRRGTEFKAADGISYRLPPELAVERVRVTETDSTWAEYGE